MARMARFRIIGRFDLAGAVTRPLRRRQTYLSMLSEMVDREVQRQVKAAVFKKRMEKAAKRKAKRR